MGLDKGGDMFSETNWYQQTNAYGISVDKIGPVTWGRILEGANDISKMKAIINPDTMLIDKDERAIISNME